MLKFTSESDLSHLTSSNPAYPVVSDLIDRLITQTFHTEHSYDTEADGFIALVEPNDVNRRLTEIWNDGDWGLTDIPWEGITKQEDMYLAVYLSNDQYGIVFVIPDTDWLSCELREYIEDKLDQQHH